MKTNWGLLTIVLFFLVGSIASAQVSRHPRVAELEKTLAKEGLELLKGRFPDKPFLIKVKIEAMFRDANRRDLAQEKLPYMDLSGEEVVDEWDDPNTSLSTLINRVRKIHVNASIPSGLSDDEVAELKETLMSSLGMIEGRDSIEINKRNWGALDKPESSLNGETVAWTAAGWILLVSALIGSAWFATARIGRSLKEAQKMNEAGSNSAGSLGPGVSFADSTKRESNSGRGGDIRFTDPVKNREIIAGSLRVLAGHPSFPGLEDMQIFHRFGTENPSEMGALLSEFPVELRMKVFGYSYEEFWLKALTEPGEITSASVELLNRCLRIQRNDTDLEFQELLVLVWRLDNKASEFFGGVDQNEAFAILSGIPKAISLKIARESFPGSWGQLLDSGFNPMPIPAKRVSQLKAKALELFPLRDMSLLKKFKRESDLLEFLKTADPGTEKEIYKVSGPDSMLSEVRPAFFRIFEQSEDHHLKLVSKLRIEEWAQALFNCARDDRRGIEKHFSDKQKFRYMELLKSFDGNSPDPEAIGEIREKIARISQELLKKSQQESTEAA